MLSGLHSLFPETDHLKYPESQDVKVEERFSRLTVSKAQKKLSFKVKYILGVGVTQMDLVNVSAPQLLTKIYLIVKVPTESNRSEMFLEPILKRLLAPNEPLVILTPVIGDICQYFLML